MERVRRVVAFALTVGRMAEEYEVKYPAAALAYYAFVSQIPLLILLVGVVSERLVTQIRATTPEFFTPGAQQLLYEGLVAGSGRVGATVLAVGVLAWSGANVVIGFQTVVDRVEHAPRESLRIQLQNASSILGSFGLVIAAVALSNLVFAVLPLGRVLAAVEPLFQFGLLTAAFLPLYYAPSRVTTSLTEALPGALTAAVGWTALLTGISFYARNAAAYALYGVLSGIIIILTSFYLGAIVLMLGVIVNRVVDEGDMDG